MNNWSDRPGRCNAVVRRLRYSQFSVAALGALLIFCGAAKLSAQEVDHSGHDHLHDHDRDQHEQPRGTGLPRSQGAALPSELVPTRQAEQTYTCSMHPQVRSNDPNGRCPICGMRLVPVTQTDPAQAQGSGADGLLLSPRAMALLDIRTTTAQRRTLTAEVSLPGRIAVDESLRRTISARVGGRVERLHVTTTGEPIRLGEPIAELYSPELMVMQQELLQAAQLRRQAAQAPALTATAKASYQAAREALRLAGLSEQAIDAIEKHGQVNEHLTLEAPFQGVVMRRSVSQGDYVSTGDTLFELADLSQVWAQLEAFESDLPHLSLGQTVSLSLTARPGQTLQGQVAFIEPWVDEQRRTARVRVTLANPDASLYPGMLVSGQVQSVGPPVLAIPASAPLHMGERALVYVRQAHAEAAVFVPREVRLGALAGGYYPVLAGLQPGEQVVVQGALRLDSERQIQGLRSMMSADGGGTPAHDHGGAGSSQQSRPQPAGGTHAH